MSNATVMTVVGDEVTVDRNGSYRQLDLPTTPAAAARGREFLEDLAGEARVPKEE
jgi:hypothetical protein